MKRNYITEDYTFTNSDLTVKDFFKEDKYKNTYSYYLPDKKKLSIYNIRSKSKEFSSIATEFDKYKEDMTSKVVNYFNKKITHKGKYTTEELKNNLGYVSSRLDMRLELDKLKKYKKNNSEIVSTVCSTIVSDTVHLVSEVDPLALENFKHFIDNKDEVVKRLPDDFKEELYTSLFTKEFFELTDYDLNKLAGIEKITITEYKLLITELKKLIAGKFGVTSEITQLFNLASYFFLTTIYYLFSRISYNTITYLRYYNGQPEHQNYFNNLISKMLWFYRLVDKRTSFSLVHIFDFLDIFVVEQDMLKDFVEKFDTYFEFSQKFFYYNDVVRNIRYRLYQNVLDKLVNSSELAVDLTDIRIKCTFKIVKFLDHTNI